MKKLWSKKHPRQWKKLEPEEKLLSDIFDTKYSIKEVVKKKIAKIGPENSVLFNKLIKKADLTEIEKDILFAFFRRECFFYVIGLIRSDLKKEDVKL